LGNPNADCYPVQHKKAKIPGPALTRIDLDSVPVALGASLSCAQFAPFLAVEKPVYQLSDRELEILALILAGLKKR